ncbi:MAG: F0F1 ATP synthase subunit C [Rhodospirillales bacterium]|nr:F0F1 ATP synthase subunit C [Rhodospirillales bacterium]
MEFAAAKLIGAGLAVIGLGGVGAGIGNIFASLISSIARNPAARGQVFGLAMLGFALVEAVALYALLIAFLVLFNQG